MLLGFGDGQIQVFDTRTKRTTMTFQDPHQRQIGEIRFDYQTKNFAVFGTPEFTLWSFDATSMNLCTHHQLATVLPSNLYKTSGDFRRGTHTLAVTDSLGTFALYLLSS